MLISQIDIDKICKAIEKGMTVEEACKNTGICKNRNELYKRVSSLQRVQIKQASLLRSKHGRAWIQ